MKLPVLLFASVPTLFAASGSGGGTGVGGVTAPNAAEVRTLSERVPAGGTVQVKFLLTQPRPIASSGSLLDLNGCSVNGVSIVSPAGDALGAAVSRNGALYIAVISPDSDWGANLDYPFLTVTMDVPASLPAGSTFPLSLTNATAQTAAGSLTFVDPKPGILTVGGTVSVSGVYPGGGTLPAGTLIHVRGNGFQPGTKITTKMKISNPIYISPLEMQFRVQETTVMDMQPFQVANPDGSQVTFYSYLRGGYVQTPSLALLRNTDPIFPAVTHSSASTGALPVSASGQFTAVAVQNPTPGPVVVTFQLQSTGANAAVVLQSGQRIMDEVSMLLGVSVVPSGDSVMITSTSGVQIVGLYGDSNTGAVMPFVPAS